jgi:hypothetical protein
MDPCDNSIGGVPLSPNAALILATAMELAISRGHTVVGTEHLAYALCRNETVRAMSWLATTSYGNNSFIESRRRLTTDVMAWLDAREIFQQNPLPVELPATLPYSSSLARVVAIAKQIGSGPVRDGSVVYNEGLIASEFLLAGLLIEGTGVGAEALTHHSGGRVNTLSLLQEIRVPPSILRDIQDRATTASGRRGWKEFSIPDEPVFEGEGKFDDGFGDLTDWFPYLHKDGSESGPRPIARHFPASPTDISNWIIPGRLIIGARPSNVDAAKLVRAGVDMFVSLLEYSFDSYRHTQYPSSLSSTERNLHFIHFPIEAFGTINIVALTDLVLELKKRVVQGRTMFIHCRGGHG